VDAPRDLVARGVKFNPPDAGQAFNAAAILSNAPGIVKKIYMVMLPFMIRM
jgi:hypothetical protein